MYGAYELARGGSTAKKRKKREKSAESGYAALTQRLVSVALARALNRE